MKWNVDVDAFTSMLYMQRPCTLKTGAAVAHAVAWSHTGFASGPCLCALFPHLVKWGR